MLDLFAHKVACNRITAYENFGFYLGSNMHFVYGVNDTFSVVSGLASTSAVSITSCQQPGMYLFAAPGAGVALVLNNGDSAFAISATFNLVYNNW